jgi:hypothetical protein
MSSIRPCRSVLSSFAAALLLTVPGIAQTTAKLPSGPPQQKPPALVDPAGPAISLQTSEAMFDVGVALNACGYDDGLADSDPIRMKVRDEVNQATQQSADARNWRDKLCSFIDEHSFGDPAHVLAQYVSLGLYITPPPDLALSVDTQDLPPDAMGVLDVLPVLRGFIAAADIHAIWVNNRPAYDAIIAQLHDPLTKMTLDTDVYLKQPISIYTDRRFLVVVEPLFSPNGTNARVYGPDYVVVVSPSHGQIHMRDVHHAYLHYEIEPLLFARAEAIDRLQPFMKMVADAPIDYNDRSDIVPFVVECLIRAVEVRTMDTGIPEYKIPPNPDRNLYEVYFRKRNEYLQQVARVRREAVEKDMQEGYVLTEYFYRQMIAFEHTPTSLEESIGPMVYGMDVPAEVGRVKSLHLVFTAGGSDILSRTPPQPSGLVLAEMKLMKGDPAAATQIAQQELKDHTPNPDRANFILARADLLNGKVPDAVLAFQQTLQISKDPRLLAWSHIYLGRIHDVNDERDLAIGEYKAALQVRDGQPDTKEAAESGLKQPYRLPGEAQDSAPGQGGNASSTPKTAPLNLNPPQ